MKKEKECPFILKEFCTKTLPRAICCLFKKESMGFKDCNLYKKAMKTIEIELWRGQITAVKNLPKGWGYQVFEKPDELGLKELMCEEEVIDR